MTTVFCASSTLNLAKCKAFLDRDWPVQSQKKEKKDKKKNFNIQFTYKKKRPYPTILIRYARRLIQLHLLDQQYTYISTSIYQRAKEATISGSLKSPIVYSLE